MLCAAVLAGLSMAGSASADSPLTSTPFHEAYHDVELVARAAETRALDADMAAFLSDPEQAIGAKVALVNALGWDLEGTANAPAYLDLLGKPETTTAIDLAPHDALCVGYMLALDDYFHPDRALRYVERAAKLMPHSYSAAMVRALVRAQVAFEDDWCQVWREVEDVAARSERGELELDLRPEADFIIFDYMHDYAEYCGQPETEEGTD
jgi:hypothetical protein